MNITDAVIHEKLYRYFGNGTTTKNILVSPVPEPSPNEVKIGEFIPKLDGTIRVDGAVGGNTSGTFNIYENGVLVATKNIGNTVATIATVNVSAFKKYEVKIITTVYKAIYLNLDFGIGYNVDQYFV